jgi:soluble lytic murein transglycosylase
MFRLRDMEWMAAMSIGVRVFGGLAVAMLCAASPLAAQISEGSKALYRARLADNAAGRFAGVSASPIAASAAVPILDTVVLWDRLRRENYKANFSELASFLSQHPDFPQETQLRRLAEKALTDEVPAAERVRFFARFAPLSAAAKFRLAEAQLALGQRDAAVATARDAWDSAGLNEEEETALLEAFASVLRPEDHLSRAERLLWSGQITAAGRLLPRLDMDRRLWLLARIALRGNAGGADARLAGVPDGLLRDAGLVNDRALWLRKNGRLSEANALLIRERPVAGKVFDKQAWMGTRLDFGRAAWRAGDPATAYAILAGHASYAEGTDLSAPPLGERIVFVEVEWLAGWLALRKLGRPLDAATHFRRVTEAARTPISQSRGDYWTGRALEAAGRADAARAAYTSAALHPDYFYGQLAHEKLGRAITIKAAPVPTLTADQASTFRAEPLVRALEAVTALEDRELQGMFMRRLVASAETAEEYALVAGLSERVGRRDLGVLAGKGLRGMGEAAGPYAAGIPLYEAAWPVLPLPESLSDRRVIIHAIARQESLFDRTARSRANALGLMQLLPATAAETARKIGLSPSTAQLTSDPIYNVQLGSAYFLRMRDSFGSDVLAVASYNAGPGNARKFIAQNGDPRLAEVDTIDWIEAIPFSETRNYVQRVLENAVVYESQFGVVRGPAPLSRWLGKSTPG